MEVVIIGGGIVGLATGLQILKKHPGSKVQILEKEGELSSHQTGHNSGVIHSGIYYKPGSLKAKNCLEGYHLLVDYCRENNIPFELCGKLIVATDAAEIPLLDSIYQRGMENGLSGLRTIEYSGIKEMEPHAFGVKAIVVPQTGIVNYKEVALSYATNIQKLGGKINVDCLVFGLKKADGNWVVQTSKGDIKTPLIINCAGLHSDKIAAMHMNNLDVRIIPFRGEYYSLRNSKRSLVRNLIYPVPDPGFPFLGVHFTRRINGEIEAGPNAVFAFKREGYKRTDFNLDDSLESLRWPGFRKVALKYWKTGLGEFYRSWSKYAFTKALQKLVPEINSDDLEQGGSGVRAQACDRNGGLIDDFCIREGSGYIHVLNAPSPAATSSLAIGKHICELAEKQQAH